MLFTDVQRSVRLNKKKKSTSISPYPDDVIDRLEGTTCGPRPTSCPDQLSTALEEVLNK